MERDIQTDTHQGLAKTQENINALIQQLAQPLNPEASESTRERQVRSLQELLNAAGANGAKQIEVQITVPGAMDTSEETGSYEDFDEMDNIAWVLRGQLQALGQPNTGDPITFPLLFSPPTTDVQPIMVTGGYSDEPTMLMIASEGVRPGQDAPVFPVPTIFVGEIRLLSEVKGPNTPTPAIPEPPAEMW